MSLINYWAKLDSEGLIIYITYGPQEDPTMVQVDTASDIYHEFYNRMPDFIRQDLPLPE